MTIARVIEGRGSSVIGCDISTPVRDAVALLASKRIGALPVSDANGVVGIFSERDVVYQIQKQGPAMLDRTVGEVMTAPAITVSSATSVLEALGLMTRRRIRHFPVVDGNTIVGFVSIGDLVKYRIDNIQHEAEALRSYIQSA
jgi:CBS domain-containing protein